VYYTTPHGKQIAHHRDEEIYIQHEVYVTGNNSDTMHIEIGEFKERLVHICYI
jgi:hypothetical protein